MPVDPITVELLRNRIASLMEEMDYHFYRSGYSTIVRESRDFSCVIVDPKGRLLVAPWMFFHAPVYYHLVQRILAHYGNRVSSDSPITSPWTNRGNISTCCRRGFAWISSNCLLSRRETSMVFAWPSLNTNTA